MAELGRIEKPSVERYSGARKLYCVPGVHSFEGAPADYQALYSRYWDEASAQIDRVESAGKVTKILCETVFAEGEEALELLTGMNERLAGLVRKKIADGGRLIPLEDREIFTQLMDWTNCLRAVKSKEVFDRILTFAREADQKRMEHLRSTIEGRLEPGEAALLVLRDEDRMRLSLPGEIEIFLVTPPSYDDILKWLRERAMQDQE